MLHDIGLHLQPGFALMIVGHRLAAHPPQPLDAIGVRVIGRSVDQMQLALQLGQYLTNQPRAGLGVRSQVVGNHNRHSATGRRAGDGRTHLFAKRRCCTARRQAAIKPAVHPVHDAEAVELGVYSRGDYQSLAPPIFAAPHPGQRRVKGKLHFILEVDIRPWQHVEQGGQIRRKVVKEVAFDQIGAGWRRR